MDAPGEGAVDHTLSINIIVKQKPTDGRLTFDSPLNILMITRQEEAS